MQLLDIWKAAQAVYKDNNTMAKLCATQAILESGFLRGGSQLANKYNNWFGIKGKGIITGKSISLPTKEYEKGKWITINQDFAWNNSTEESFMQHRKLMEKTRYAACWRAKDIPEAAQSVWKAGYATDPKYPNLLISTYNLYLKKITDTK